MDNCENSTLKLDTLSNATRAEALKKAPHQRSFFCLFVYLLYWFVLKFLLEGLMMILYELKHVAVQTWCNFLNRTAFVCLLSFYYHYILFFGATTQHVLWPPHSWGFYNTHNDTSQTVEFLWTSVQLVAETSTSQHTTVTTKRQTCLPRDSKPQHQPASGRRPKPKTARPPGWASNWFY